jgi:hypothetical protein
MSVFVERLSCEPPVRGQQARGDGEGVAGGAGVGDAVGEGVKVDETDGFGEPPG